MKIFNMFNILLNATSETVSNVAETANKLEFHPEDAIPMLKHMGIGMLTIIIIIGIIIIVTAIINKLFSQK